MKKRLLTTLSVLGIGVAIAGYVVPASAGVIDSFTVAPAIIDAGQTVQLNVTLTLTADSGDYNPNLAGGLITINSGYGLSQSFNVGFSGTTETFSAVFAYPDAGMFMPTVTGSVNYTQNYTYYGITGYSYYQYLVSPGYTYNCGGFFYESCSVSPVYGYGSYANYAYLTGYNSQAAIINDSGSLSVVPEPASMVLLGVGLLGTGVMARRRQFQQDVDRAS
jgi:hypothetical protein